MKMFHYLPVSGLSNFAVGSVPGFDKKSIEGYWILDAGFASKAFRDGRMRIRVLDFLEYFYRHGQCSIFEI